MISFGERVAIIFPSIFFFTLVIINTVEITSFCRKLVERGANISKSEWVSIAYSQTMSNHFIEYIILSITNGLSLIFVLEQQEFGVVTMIVGVVSSLIGLTYKNYEAETLRIELGLGGVDRTLKSEYLFSILFSLSVAYIGFFWFHGSPYTFPFLSDFPTSWVSFLLFFIVGLIFDRKIMDRLLPLGTITKPVIEHLVIHSEEGDEMQ